MELLLRLIPNFSKTQHVQLCHLPRLCSYCKSIDKKDHRNWPIYDLHSRRGQRSGHNKVGRSCLEMPNIYSQVKLLTYPTVCRVLKTPFLTVLGMGGIVLAFFREWSSLFQTCWAETQHHLTNKVLVCVCVCVCFIHVHTINFRVQLWCSLKVVKMFVGHQLKWYKDRNNLLWVCSIVWLKNTLFFLSCNFPRRSSDCF